MASIEIDIFNLWERTPNLDIVDKAKQQQQEQQDRNNYVHRVGDENETDPPIMSADDINGRETAPWTMVDWLQCDVCGHWWEKSDIVRYA